MSSPLVSLSETTDNDDRDEKTMTDKPLLLLDIDGVLNLFPRAMSVKQRVKGDPYPEIRDHEVHVVRLSDVVDEAIDWARSLVASTEEITA